MEELSIEEKAKRYDKAIEIARALNNGKSVAVESGTTVYECIFPEIKEKGYEEIKKQLIEFLDIFSKCGRNGNYKKWNTSDCANWLIWVKKQNELNPYSGVSFEYNGHTWGMCARDGGVEIGCDKQLIAYINLPQEKDEFDNFSKVANDNPIGNNAKDFIMCTAPNHGV